MGYEMGPSGTVVVAGDQQVRLYSSDAAVVMVQCTRVSESPVMVAVGNLRVECRVVIVQYVPRVQCRCGRN